MTVFKLFLSFLYLRKLHFSSVQHVHWSGANLHGETQLSPRRLNHEQTRQAALIRTLLHQVSHVHDWYIQQWSIKIHDFVAWCKKYMPILLIFFKYCRYSEINHHTIWYYAILLVPLQFEHFCDTSPLHYLPVPPHLIKLAGFNFLKKE